MGLVLAPEQGWLDDSVVGLSITGEGARPRGLDAAWYVREDDSLAGRAALMLPDQDGDGVRDKDGKKLSLLYQTSTNAVRQDFQALIKQWWEEIGVETELRNLDASVFFGGDPGSPDTFQKFYADIEMYTNNFSGVDPQAYMANWRCSDIPGPDTQWQGANIQRFCDPAYDALVDEMAGTADLAERGRLAMAMNDMLMQSYSIIPLIHRGGVSAHANSLGGIRMSDWDSELWNIAEWHRIPE